MALAGEALAGDNIAVSCCPESTSLSHAFVIDVVVPRSLSSSRSYLVLFGKSQATLHILFHTFVLLLLLLLAAVAVVVVFYLCRQGRSGCGVGAGGGGV